MKRTWTVTAAIAVVAVLLVLVVPTTNLLSGTSTAHSATRPFDLNAPLSGAFKREVLAVASASAEKGDLPAAKARTEIARIGSESPMQILTAAGYTPEAIQALASCGPLSGSCGVDAGAGLGGCAMGAGLGVIGGGPIGAGVGCAVIGATTLLVYQFGLDQAGAQSNLNVALQWVNANQAAAGNDFNLTETSYENLLSSLNFSEDAFQRMADNAALLQLGNSSFSIAQDEFQSGLDAQMGTILGSYAAQVQEPFQLLQDWADAQLASGAVFSSTGIHLAPAVATPDVGQSIAATYSGTSFGSFSATVNTTVYIPPGTQQLFGTGVGAWTIHPVLGAGWTAVATTPVSIPNLVTGNVVLKYNFTAGWYQLSSGAIGMSLNIPGGALPATAGALDMSGWSSSGGGTTTIAAYAGVGPNGYNGITTVTFGDPGPQFLNSAGAPIGYVPIGAATYIGMNLGAALGKLTFQAATNGEVYWSFLRSIGYTSVNQIPPDCIVPAPYQVLPSDLNLGNLTLTQLQSLYMAWLQGLGTFYNASLNATSFCGTQHQHQFHLGNVTWGNLQVNATGDVYLNNGTSPISLNGRALATELYGNTSTWALTNTQLLLMPTLATVDIPVGVKWAVPAGNPIEIYAVQAGQMFRATGNGSSPNLAAFHLLATVAPGDSLFLTSCVVGGAAQTNCTVTVQTINTTVANLSCLGTGSNNPASCQQQTQPGGTGTFGGFPNPFAWLANLFSGLFGGGPLGAFLGGIASALLILAVIAVLAYVAIVEVEAWGGKKRGSGGGSGGGSTVVVAGGR